MCQLWADPIVKAESVDLSEEGIGEVIGTQGAGADADASASRCDSLLGAPWRGKPNVSARSPPS
jgi:hypothetical protein